MGRFCKSFDEARDLAGVERGLRRPAESERGPFEADDPAGQDLAGALAQQQR
jgi:hypothetical protein